MMIPQNILQKTIGVLGLSRSGLASLNALVKAGATVYAYDDLISPRLPDGVVQMDYQNWPWHEIDMMVISPGIPHLYPEPHPAATLARHHDVAIISDVELMMMAKPQAKIIGITGTNGKSTIVSLIDHILKFNAIKTALGGNIGTAALSLDDPGKDGVIILELSSYQLEITPSLKLDAGGIINITPDHIERHGGWDGYVAAKAILVQTIKPSGLLVLGEGEEVASLASQSAAPVVTAHQQDAPDLSACPALTGPHNAANTAMAMAIVSFLGVDSDSILAALPHFCGLPHRMEEITLADGIRFVNDSKATNGEATAEALKSFTDIYWIAGGEAKEDGLGAALDVIDAVRHAYLIGASAEMFAQQIGTACPHTTLKTMEGALRQAIDDASSQAYDDSHPATVLLSPAAASFDQFDSFEQRGEAFRELVMTLASPEDKPKDGGRHV